MSRIVPNLTLLHQFIATAEEGSISRAATQLGISQPALSKNIRKFEEIVGTDLFYRHTRGAELSEAGQAFLKHAELIALEYEHALQEVSNILENRKATIRIGAQGVWSSTYLPHAAKKFRKLFPKHQLSVSSGNTDELSKGLKIGKLNFTHGKFTSKYHSFKHLDVYGESIMYGHTHDLQRHTKTHRGGTISAWSLGCLKDIEADEDWLRGSLTNWNHGFAVVNFFSNGNFNVEVVEIINGKTTLWGNLIKG